MEKHDLDIIRGAVEEAVRVTVNGKIDAIKKTLDEHIVNHAADRDEIKELLKTRDSLAFLYRGLLGFGAAAAAWIAIKSVIPHE